MRWLKRLVGSTDAMQDALARAGSEGLVDESAKSMSRPGATKFSATDSELIFTCNVSGLDPETVRVEAEGSSVRVKASGHGAPRKKLVLDERIQLPEGSDPDGATASYEGTQLTVRIPKSALPGKLRDAAIVDDDEAVDS
jgi:HSP20 family molecular chaperone IbpA